MQVEKWVPHCRESIQEKEWHSELTNKQLQQQTKNPQELWQLRGKRGNDFCSSKRTQNTQYRFQCRETITQPKAFEDLTGALTMWLTRTEWWLSPTMRVEKWPLENYDRWEARVAILWSSETYIKNRDTQSKPNLRLEDLTGSTHMYDGVAQWAMSVASLLWGLDLQLGRSRIRWLQHQNSPISLWSLLNTAAAPSPLPQWVQWAPPPFRRRLCHNLILRPNLWAVVNKWHEQQQGSEEEGRKEGARPE